MSVEAVPVTTGFTWTTAAVGLLNLLVGGVLVALIRSRPQLKKLNNEREANLLKERAEEMEAMRARQDVLEAEVRAANHKSNNIQACFDALLMLLEAAPEKAAEHVAKIKEMRARQMQAEATEKGFIVAAAVVRSGADRKEGAE